MKLVELKSPESMGGLSFSINPEYVILTSQHPSEDNTTIIWMVDMGTSLNSDQYLNQIFVEGTWEETNAKLAPTRGRPKKIEAK